MNVTWHPPWLCCTLKRRKWSQKDVSVHHPHRSEVLMATRPGIGERQVCSSEHRCQKKKNVQNINYLACMEAKKITHQDKLHRYCDQNEARCTLGGRNSQERTSSCWLSWPPHTCLHTKINVIKINTGWLHIHVGSRIAKETERKGTGKRAHLVGSFRFCKVWRSVDQVNLFNTLNCTLTNS